MELVNGSRFDMQATQGLDKEARPWLVVMAKATYRIDVERAGRPVLADEQTKLLVSDVFEGEPGFSAPLIEADYVPHKAVCDVIVKGSAHAPRGKAVKELEAGISIGPIRKLVRVVGERRWQKRGSKYVPSDAEPFVTMPITYGRAFGGMYDHTAIESDDLNDFLAHPANLVGCGYAKDKFLHLIKDQAVPNIEARDQRIESPEKDYAPAGLGPIARNWQPRLAFGGTYDQHWQDDVFPLLPADFDERFYQCAPSDQQMPYPKGGEEIVLVNLTPGGGQCRFKLPKLALPMAVLTKDRKQQALTPNVDTIAIDTDKLTLALTWRARLPLARGLREIHTVAAGSVCKRWWKSRVYGSEDCGCGGIETNDEDLAPVTEALT